jgi:hypothetical protein
MCIADLYVVDGAAKLEKLSVSPVTMTSSHFIAMFIILSVWSVLIDYFSMSDSFLWSVSKDHLIRPVRKVDF